LIKDELIEFKKKKYEFVVYESSSFIDYPDFEELLEF
jgi:hypothetical protein